MSCYVNHGAASTRASQTPPARSTKQTHTPPHTHTRSIDNRLRVWDHVLPRAAEGAAPDRELVHSNDFNRYLTPFRAEWDPKVCCVCCECAVCRPGLCTGVLRVLYVCVVHVCACVCAWGVHAGACPGSKGFS